jgi:FKBP12-rapamycin complex-associated protein
MDEHMHLVLPALMRLLKPSVLDAPVEIRRATIKTLSRLLPTMHVAGHASAILHPLTRVLDG